MTEAEKCWSMSTGTSTNSCDRCGRSLDGKGWVEVSQMKICGICQYEINHKNNDCIDVEHLYED